MSEPPGFTDAKARKSLGQHFLFDPSILNRAALAAGPVEHRHVFEVGPGPGGLTRALLDAGAAKVTAIEADERFAAALREWPEAVEGRLTVIEGDARKADYEALHSASGISTPAMIVANLPYNVGTPLLVGWLKARDWRGEMALMFQKEVALRICAKPGDPHYGRLAVLAQAVSTPHLAFTLPPGAFKPPPKVDSAVAVLHPLPDSEIFRYLEAMEAVTGAAFGQRRKMLRASLKPLAKQIGQPAGDWLNSLEIDASRRAETLDQSEFRTIATSFAVSGG